MAKEVLLIVIANNAIWVFLQFLIARHDKKTDEKDGLRAAIKAINEKLDELETAIKSKLKKQEKDNVRNQLLMLLCIKPEEEQEILTLGEHYFKVLKGNWYMTSMFNKWLMEHNVAKPEWFNN